MALRGWLDGFEMTTDADLQLTELQATLKQLGDPAGDDEAATIEWAIAHGWAHARVLLAGRQLDAEPGCPGES